MQQVYKLDAHARPVPCAINDPELHTQLAAGLFCVGSSQIAPACWVLTSFDMVAGQWLTTVDAEGYPCHLHEVAWPTVAQAFDGHAHTTAWVRSVVEGTQVPSC